MTFYPAIYAALTGHAALAALVGDRVWPGFIPEGILAGGQPYPCLTYEIESDPLDTHDDRTNGRFAELFVDVTVYSRVRSVSAEIEPIGAAVVGAMEALDGNAHGPLFSGTRLELTDFPEWVPAVKTWQQDLRFAAFVTW